jgi:hypothetical protein
MLAIETCDSLRKNTSAMSERPVLSLSLKLVKLQHLVKALAQVTRPAPDEVARPITRPDLLHHSLLHLGWFSRAHILI